MKFRLACVQFHSQLGVLDQNLALMAEWCARAAATGAGVVVFPEACLTGYCRPKQMVELARPFAGALQARVAELAQTHQLLLAFGMPEQVAGHVYNSMIAVGPEGKELGRYRKMHLWAAESRWATPGKAYTTFESGGVRFGMWLCYDTRFPEVARTHALQGTEVALVASAWRMTHVEEWRLCVRARAIDNGIFVAGSDAWLRADHFQCAGGSIIAGPDGGVLALAEKEQAGMIVAEIDTAILAARRQDLPLLEHRLPEMYGALVQPWHA